MTAARSDFAQLLLVDDRTHGAELGGVELESDTLAEAARTRGMVPNRVATGAVLKAVERVGGRTLVFTQRQGHLSAAYAAAASSWLDAGARVVEKNVFALASRHRPDRDGYYMVVMSQDGLRRASDRAFFGGGLHPRRTVVLPNPQLHDLEPGGARRKQGPFTFLRIGRPSAIKWSLFEVDFVRRLAARRPDRDFRLVCIGAPEEVRAAAGAVPSNMLMEHLPYGQDLRAAYQSADAYLHHSRIGETYGNTVWEAREVGLPIVLGVDLRWDAAHVDHVVADPRSSYGTPKTLVANAAAVWTRMTTIGAGRAPQGMTAQAYLDALVAPEDHVVARPTPGASLQHMRDLKRGSELMNGAVPWASWLVEAARAFRDRAATDDF